MAENIEQTKKDRHRCRKNRRLGRESQSHIERFLHEEVGMRKVHWLVRCSHGEIRQSALVSHRLAEQLK